MGPYTQLLESIQMKKTAAPRTDMFDPMLAEHKRNAPSEGEVKNYTTWAAKNPNGTLAQYYKDSDPYVDTFISKFPFGRLLSFRNRDYKGTPAYKVRNAMEQGYASMGNGGMTRTQESVARRTPEGNRKAYDRGALKNEQQAIKDYSTGVNANTAFWNSGVGKAVGKGLDLIYGKRPPEVK